MSDLLIRARNISKMFRLYEKPSGRFFEWMTLGRTIRHREFWALRDFSLDVARGECIGIIGANGAGKSTLLRILSGTLSASSGEYAIDGRVLSLLELGTGFNPHLTGRQNVIHTAALLGYQPEDVYARMERIEQFADLGEFFDRPIRIYSSGMHVRLGFSMFASFDPTVLIVDEALAVGDVAFQRKCFRRMEELVEDRSRAILLVAHDLTSIQRLCQKVLWLDHGQIRLAGEARDVVEAYTKFMFAGDRESGVAAAVAAPAAPATVEKQIPSENLLKRSPSAVVYPFAGVELLGVWLEDALGRPTASAMIDQPVTICYSLKFHRPVERPVFGVRVATVRGELLVATNTLLMETPCGPYNPGDVETVRWPIKPGLMVADYFISCGVSTAETPYEFLMRQVDGYQFSVLGKWRGSALCSLNESPRLESAR